MGGHIALRFLHDFPEAADKAVLTSPMIDINIPTFPRWLVRFIAFCASRAGFGSFLFGWFKRLFRLKHKV